MANNRDNHGLNIGEFIATVRDLDDEVHQFKGDFYSNELKKYVYERLAKQLSEQYIHSMNADKLVGGIDEDTMLEWVKKSLSYQLAQGDSKLQTMIQTKLANRLSMELTKILVKKILNDESK